MQIIVLSDTHNLHRQLQVPPGDLLLHAGDVSNTGTQEEIVDFLDWFAAQPHPHKVFIAGNHDFYLEEASKEAIEALIPSNIHYLNEELIEIEGIRIFGTPYTPIPFRRWWAFNEHRGSAMQAHWDLIPDNLDILLVHGPPKNILDLTTKNEAVGCANLAKTLAIKQPKYCIFGHIHEARGAIEKGNTTYINASSVERYADQVRDVAAFVFEYAST